MAIPRKCSVDSCDKSQIAHGFCDAHYRRWKRYGDPLGGGTQQGAPEKFLREVVLSYQGDDCLIWPFYKDRTGYAKIHRNSLVHRIVCEEINGPPPTPRHEAAHSCGRGKKGCCTPNHLRWATHAENEADKRVHGTQPRGSRHGLSKLTETQVREIRQLRQSMSQRAVGDLFGVSRATIGEIDRQKNWAWLV